ncbi:hypothetical protein L211DRAFT_85707 [Terfezia boudieri ATCC MYA-4762]|uniref:Secreted protein n=1 Tax=Terfezia boudieri ATCC MYA-4762 TaxID=1051890 RepID=A0A3N4LRR5_9PEZI|nr:hypothetical protein L211DRAFT_85707 [Terfezia boudieri ATCC MYA-4762]
MGLLLFSPLLVPCCWMRFGSGMNGCGDSTTGGVEDEIETIGFIFRDSYNINAQGTVPMGKRKVTPAWAVAPREHFYPHQFSKLKSISFDPSATSAISGTQTSRFLFSRVAPRNYSNGNIASPLLRRASF